MTEPCPICNSRRMAEQPGNAFPGLLLCQEPECEGFVLTDAGAMDFHLELEREIQRNYEPEHC